MFFYGTAESGSHEIPTDVQILNAAESAFSELGFERATLADIAREAGIRPQWCSIISKSKDELYGQVVNNLFDSLRTELSKSMAPGAFSQQIVSLAQAFVDFSRNRSAFAPIVIREIIDGRGPAREILLRELAPVLGLVENGLSCRVVRIFLKVSKCVQPSYSSVQMSCFRWLWSPQRSPVGQH